MKEEALTIRESIHGPVVRAIAGKALALRVAGIDQPGIVDQYLKMMRARTFTEFEAALRPLQMPFFTVMYADRDGHIMHLFGGRTPVRPAGDYQWAGIVPGTGAATLWTTTHPYQELPRVADPPSGWLQNANDPPWTTTFRWRSIPASFRATWRLGRCRSGPSDPPSWSKRRVHHSRRIRPVQTFHAHGSCRSAARRSDPAGEGGRRCGRDAAAVLEAWDRNADAESKGAVLFEAWFRLLSRAGVVFATPWSETSPRTTPDGLRDPAAAVRALAQAAEQVKKTHGSADVAWGQVYRLRVGGKDLPANGGPGDLGIFRVLVHRRQDGKMRASGGDSYVATVEFSQPVRARSLISYGNASQRGSAHIDDQIELFAKKQLKPVWLVRAEIERNLERREVVKR
jgi:acyl-homoserine-lactone acylase